VTWRVVVAATVLARATSRLDDAREDGAARGAFEREDGRRAASSTLAARARRPRTRGARDDDPR